MIPKIIHLCWLSGDPYPADIQKCLDTWKEHLPDYEIWLWDTNRFDINSTIWTKQAFNAKKYAFAADYIRLYALYNYGGIYLDSDVIVYKSFNELLDLPYFIGHDQIGAFEAAIIGAKKGTQWIKDVLDRYDGRHFIKEDGSYDMLELPIVFHHTLIEKGYKFHKLNEIVSFNSKEKEMFVFNGNFFNSRDALEVRRTSKSFCAHNYAGAWQKKNKSIKTQIKKILPKWLLKSIINISHITWNRNKYRWLMIPFEKQRKQNHNTFAI